MIAIIKALFGRGNSNKDQGPEYFLDSDKAKSLGNADYMRTPKSVKKSYPKGAGKINVLSGEVEESISATQKKVGGMTDGTTSSKPTTTSSSSSSSFGSTSGFQSNSSFNRRGGDSNMDSFRKMARDIKKK